MGCTEYKSAAGLTKPWRFDTSSEKQFFDKADTGDILIFIGNSGNAKLIRTLTGGNFDHVAMILKFEADQDDLYLVEATGNKGVALNKWEYLRPHIGESKFYKKVIFRHVHFNRHNDKVDKLELFLKEAIG